MQQRTVHSLENLTSCFVLPPSSMCLRRREWTMCFYFGATSYPRKLGDSWALSGWPRILTQVFCFPEVSFCLSEARHAQHPPIGRPRSQAADRPDTVLLKDTQKCCRHYVRISDCWMIKHFFINQKPASSCFGIILLMPIHSPLRKGRVLQCIQIPCCTSAW